ncbi:MAG: iron(III) transport system substrate-binding protein [Methylophagaceae bacterium]|jgi:iron(III) transport system substrate-binding protein
MNRNIFGFLALLILIPQASADSSEVNIYSYRQPFLIEPITAAFTDKTGIKVNVLYAKNGIAEKLTREGKYSPADIILTSDFNRLLEISEKGLTQANLDKNLLQNIPKQYRDNKQHWFALTTRARVLYVAKNRQINTQGLTYEDLATEQFRGRVCIRSGKHPYNISLIASIIAHHGEQQAKAWLTGLKDNLARKPQGNDRGQIKAIKEGVCDIALGNSYYFGQMLKDNQQKVWADAVNIVFPNQQNRGAHINISGMAMAKHSPNQQNAKRLMAYLSSVEAQSLYASLNMEYPVNSSAESSEIVGSWGDFKADTLLLSETIRFRQSAYRLLDEVKFDL